MSKQQVSEKVMQSHDLEENSLKGTFISVMLIGGFIIVTWAGVWGLFLSR